MAKDHPDPAVESYVESAESDIRPILDSLLALVRETLPDAEESVKWGRPVFTLERDVCYVAKARAHDSLGFYEGAEIDDPRGLLQGSGKKLRHVKVEVGAPVPEDELRKLLEGARELVAG